MTPIHTAAGKLLSKSLKVLYNAFDETILDISNSAGITPLMYSCACGSVQCAKFLLKHEVSSFGCIIETVNFTNTVLPFFLTCNNFPYHAIWNGPRYSNAYLSCSMDIIVCMLPQYRSLKLNFSCQ